ncbi:MAG: PAS domain S-box protein, partial [Alphaproteobacteria bacterium]|nr:PAS domain S-box protein [Alphaproteobacteria bacterium]
CIVMPAATAVPPALTLQAWFGSDLLRSWSWWAIADGMGALVVTPLLLVWGRKSVQLVETMPWSRWAELVGFFVALVLVTRFVFTYSNPEGATLATYSYLPFPLLLWVALRFGLRTATLASFTLVAFAVWYEGRAGGGVFAVGEGLIALQAFLIVMVAATLLLAATLAEREEAGRLLRENRERLELALEGADLGLWDWACDTGSVVFDRRWAEMLGYHPAELEPSVRTWEDLLHPDDGPPAIAILQQHLDGRTPFYQAEFRLRTKDGEWRWIHGCGKVVERGESGEPVRATGIHRDIDEHKRAEAASIQLGRIIEGAASEIYLFDTETLRFVDANRGARENLGYSLDELKQMTPLDLKREMTPEAFNALLAPLRAGGNSEARFSTTHRRKDGSAYSVDVWLQLVRGEDKPLFFADVHDITERLVIEQQLRQAQKMEAIGQLTGGVAHDFNNLLAVIIGNLEFLISELPDDDEREARAATVMRAAERGAELTRRLLAFSRQQPLAPRAVDLNDLVSDVMELLRRTLGETIEVDTALAGDLWQSCADPGQLEAALLNLAVNAQDAMPDGGRLTIETGNVKVDSDDALVASGEVAPGDYVMLAVADTGAGMPADVRERAFEPFFTTKEVGKGTGLGLSMIFGFCKQSGGHVMVDSATDRGTTVRLYLPRLTGAMCAPKKPSVNGADVKGDGETVLVVEDDPDVREVTVTLLKGMGYSVLAASDGESALEVAETAGPIALLVTDVVLGGEMTGRQTAEALVARRPDIGVLYMSGYALNSIQHLGRLDDGVVLLQKPFRKADLASKVGQVLATRSEGAQA